LASVLFGANFWIRGPVSWHPSREETTMTTPILQVLSFIAAILALAMFGTRRGKRERTNESRSQAIVDPRQKELFEHPHELVSR
jgi:hypothetical protein